MVFNVTMRPFQVEARDLVSRGRNIRFDCFRLFVILRHLESLGIGDWFPNIVSSLQSNDSLLGT